MPPLNLRERQSPLAELAQRTESLRDGRPPRVIERVLMAGAGETSNFILGFCKDPLVEQNGHVALSVRLGIACFQHLSLQDQFTHRAIFRPQHALSSEMDFVFKLTLMRCCSSLGHVIESSGPGRSICSRRLRFRSARIFSRRPIAHAFPGLPANGVDWRRAMRAAVMAIVNPTRARPRARLSPCSGHSTDLPQNGFVRP